MIVWNNKRQFPVNNHNVADHKAYKACAVKVDPGWERRSKGGKGLECDSETVHYKCYPWILQTLYSE